MQIDLQIIYYIWNWEDDIYCRKTYFYSNMFCFYRYEFLKRKVDASEEQDPC